MDFLSLELWRATLQGEFNYAHLLISRGANVNQPINTAFGANNVPLLHCAVAQGDIQLMHLLIHHGADIRARDSNNRTVLHFAVMSGDCPGVIEMLINKGALVDAPDVSETTPLFYAVQLHFNKTAQKLIARGASIDAVGHINNISILHVAVMCKNMIMAKVLINRKVNMEAKDNGGCTPLLVLFIMERCHMDMLQLLLQNGADVNVKCRNYGFFPLYWASRKFSLDHVHLLLKWGARINEVTGEGNTALHEACRFGKDDVTALLIKFGANINAHNQEGKTPFELLPEDSPASEATAKIIIREAVKIEALGQSLCEGYIQMIQSCQKYAKFDQECRDEVRRMRSEKIDVEDHAVSFFYIFAKSEEKLAALLRNKNIVTAFESSDYRATFRQYAVDLTTNFEKAKQRANFYMNIEDGLVDMWGDILTVSILQNIAAYFEYDGIIEN